MSRLCMYVLSVLCVLTLSSGMAAGQDSQQSTQQSSTPQDTQQKTQWVKDKNTGEWVKVKQSGKNKLKVKKTGKKHKVKQSSSGTKVKSTGAKIRFAKPSPTKPPKNQGQTSTIDKAAASDAKPVELGGEKGEEKAPPAAESGASLQKASSPADDVISSAGE